MPCGIRRTKDSDPVSPIWPSPARAIISKVCIATVPSGRHSCVTTSYYANRDDRDGAKTEALFGIPSQNLFAKDWTIGARYYVTPAFMVAAEYHHVYGAGWLPSQDNPDLSATDKKWDLFALLVSYRF